MLKCGKKLDKFEKTRPGPRLGAARGARFVHAVTFFVPLLWSKWKTLVEKPNFVEELSHSATLFHSAPFLPFHTVYGTRNGGMRHKTGTNCVKSQNFQQV